MGAWYFFVAILLGAIIGLQREFDKSFNKAPIFAGIRTFILAALLGSILGFLGGSYLSPIVLGGFITIILFSAISYYLTYKRTGTNSIVTEISLALTYLLGLMCVLGDLEIAVILSIVIVAIIAFKDKLHSLVRKMNKKEILGIIKFALISLVVLPLLPNRNFSPMDFHGLGNFFVNIGLNADFLYQLDVFNFYHIWLMVIFIAGINFIGYFLVKILDTKKSYGVLGFVGGLVSSTAVTLSMASESKKNKKHIFPFVLATTIAMSIMFLRVVVEVAVVNPSLLSSLAFPMILMFVFGISSIFLISKFKKKKKNKKTSREKIEFKQPFSLGPALKFGLFFLLVLFVSKCAQLTFGNAGLYGASVLSGLADIDAITLSMASLSKSLEITNIAATTSILLAAFSNTLVKVGMAFVFGSKRFGRYIGIIFGIILLIGFLALFIF
jgi:uncharacterized membrane protein (DUF4010 family)